MKNFLIDLTRVTTNPYYLDWRREARLVGFITVTPYTAEPSWKTWDKPLYNRFTGIAHEAFIDEQFCFVLPVFFNDKPCAVLFDGDSVNGPIEKPWFAFFKGNDDWHYAMRFKTESERSKMVEFFGEDLGFLEDPIGHN